MDNFDRRDYSRGGYHLDHVDVEIQGEGATFYVRGLLVREHIELNMVHDEVFQTDNLEFLTKVFMAGVQGWDNIEIPTDSDNDVTIEAIEALPEEIVIPIGKYIWENLTEVSEQEREKLRGWTRFILHCGDDDNDTTAESFNCESCIQQRLAEGRNCSRFTQQERDRLYEELTGKSVQAKQAASATNRYRSGPKTYSSPDKAEDKASEQRYVHEGSIHVGKWEYPECPISFVDNFLKQLVSVFYKCHAHDTLPFDGGMMQQPYKLYRGYEIVSSEVESIKQERRDDMDSDAPSNVNSNIQSRSDVSSSF